MFKNSINKKNKENKRKKFFCKKRILFLIFIFLLIHFVFFLAQDVSANTLQEVDRAVSGGASVVARGLSAPLFWVFNAILLVVFSVVGLFLIIAVTIFDWAINPNNFLMVMKMNSIYEVWQIVRDFLNLGFILVLLYSAFCTVFQIEKYHLKKILLMLVLMALLVNFSYPITRFIIDSSNITMYYIISKAFPSLNEKSGLGAVIVEVFGVALSLLPGSSSCNFEASAWYSKIAKHACKGITSAVQSIFYPQEVAIKLMSAIIFMFLLAITLFVMAMLLVIRIVILAIVIMFSPVGFVASIFPSTQKFADMWWNSLFKQSFFGPIMAFMIYISLYFMKGAGRDTADPLGFSKVISSNFGSSPYSSILVTGMIFAIPIVLLWTGIIVSQKLGASGAGAVMSYGRKYGEKALKSNFVRRHGGRGLATVGRIADQNILTRGLRRFPGPLGRLYGGALDQTTGRMADVGKTIRDKAINEKIENISKKRDFENMSNSELLNLASPINNKDEFSRAGIIKELANRGLATDAHLKDMGDVFEETSQVFKELQNKVKSYNPVAAFSNITDPVKKRIAYDNFINSKQFKLDDLDENALRDEKFVEALIQNKKLSTGKVLDLAKDSRKKAALSQSFKNLSNVRNDHTSDEDKAITMSYFALSGKLDPSKHDDFAAYIGKNLDEKTAANMNWTSLLSSSTHQDVIAQNVRRNQIVNIARGIEDDKSARLFVDYLRKNGPHQAYIGSNPNLQNF